MLAPQAFTLLLSALGLSLPELLSNPALVTNVLNYHIIPNNIIRNLTALAAAGTLATRFTGKSVTASGS